MNNVDLTVKIGNVTLKKPVMPASGTFEPQLAQIMDFDQLGAIVLKTFTKELREGNPLPRVTERPFGMLNSIGIPSKGISYFMDTLLPYFKQYKSPLVVSISAPTADGFAELASEISVDGVDVIEANISCPNIEADGKAFAMGVTATENVVKKLRKATNLPLWVKLTPNTGEMPEIAKAAEFAGADAAIISNTILAMAIDVKTFKPSLGNIMGGYSGPAIKPIIIRHVYQCSKAISMPIIGCGGVSCAEDVVEYMLAGASAVQVGTSTFIQPNTMPDIIRDLENFCSARKICSVSKLTKAVIDSDEKIMESDYAL